MKDSTDRPRVLLITPAKGLWKDEVEHPWISTQPLGVAYIAAAAREAGYPVEVCDAYSLGTPAADIIKRVREYRPAIVGIPSLTPQWPDAARLADLVKSVDGSILTVAGGPHVTALPEAAARHVGVDVAVIGEGEEAMKDICAVVERGAGLEGVTGIVYSRNGSVQATPPRDKIDNLDGLPFPAHDLLPEPATYNPFPAWGNKGNFACMVSGRGCPYNCSFCDVTSQQGRRYRLRSAENIVDELSWLYHDFGVTTFSFRDASMICNKKRLLEMCELIVTRGLDIAWTCSSRANEIDGERLVAMKKAGCRLIQYGVEVGNNEMMKSIKKLDRDSVARAVSDTRRAGIQTHGYFMFGFVDETPETIEETITFSKKLDLDSAGFGVMVPFPGTREFETYREAGLLLSEDWRDYDVLGKPVYRHKHVSNEQLEKAPRRAYRQFYLRPRIIWRHAGKMLSPRVLRNYVRSIRELMFR